jgi:hypothetical protein
MACIEFFSNSNCYIIRWNVIVLFRFENRRVFCRTLYFRELLFDNFVCLCIE